MRWRSGGPKPASERLDLLGGQRWPLPERLLPQRGAGEQDDEETADSHGAEDDMTLLLLASVLASLQGPAAVFWSGGRTWLVDVERAELHVAQGWYTSGATQGVQRYRLRTEASRVGYGPASRWTILERAESLGGAWSPVTPPPDLPATGGVQDERAVLQFLGDRVVVARFQRRFGDGPLDAEVVRP